MRTSKSISKVSVRGQTAIPKELREALDIKPGMTLVWTVRDHSLVATPGRGDPIENLRGILKDKPSLTEELLRERRLDKEREEAKYRRMIGK